MELFLKKMAIAAALSLTLAACSNQSASNAPSASDTVASKAPQSNAAMMISAGAFSGRSDHITTGTAKLVKTDNGFVIKLSDDFELDGAPDPIVAVGNNEAYLAENKLGALKNRTGAQSYALPARIAAQPFTQVYIWCEKFSVPLGVATLEGGNASHGS